MTGVIATDRRGRIVIINAAALDILNLRSERIVGTPLLECIKTRPYCDFQGYSSLKKNVYDYGTKIRLFNVSSQSSNVNLDLLAVLSAS